MSRRSLRPGEMASTLPPTGQTPSAPISHGWWVPAPGRIRRSLHWGVAGTAVLLVHASALLALSQSPAPEGLDTQAPVMTVDLEPAPPQEAPPEPDPPAPTEAAKSDTPPPPEPVQQQAVKPEPPPPEPPPEPPPPEEPPVAEETPPEPIPEPPPAPPDVKPAVTLPPKPVPKPRRPPKPVPRPHVTEPTPTQTEAAAPPPTARPVAAAPSAAAIQSWQAQLVAHLNRYKRYPADAQMQRREGVVTVRFRLMPDGSAQAARIVRSSGIDSLDEEALALIARAAPLPRPDPMNGPIEIAVPVQFKLR